MEIVTYCSHSMCSVVFLLCWVAQCLRCIRFTFAFAFPFISSYLLCQSYRISWVCVREAPCHTMDCFANGYVSEFIHKIMREAEKVEAKLRFANIEYKMDMPQKVDCVQHVDGSFSVMRHRYMKMEITLSYDVCVRWRRINCRKCNQIPHPARTQNILIVVWLSSMLNQLRECVNTWNGME